MDKATELLAATVGKVPSDTDKAVSALRDLLGARIDGMDVATKLLADSVLQFPSATDKAIAGLHTLLSVRFSSVEEAMALLSSGLDRVLVETARSMLGQREILVGEIRNVQDVATQKFEAIEGTFASNALALTAALAAQKEAAAEQNKSNTLAITKSEQATKETIAANAAQTTNSLASQAATIADLKDRVVRIESGGLASATARTESRAEKDVGQNASYYRIALVIAGLTTLIAIISLVAFVVKK